MLLTMNIQSSSSDSTNFSTALRNLKLSPDSVAIEPLALGIHEKVQCVEREDSLEIPDLMMKTSPLHKLNVQQQYTTGSTPPRTSLVQKQSSAERLPSSAVPKNAPKIPPRSPITKSHARCFSEGAATSNSRRAIFGQYWNQGTANRTTSQGSGIDHHLATTVDPKSLKNNVTMTPPPTARGRKRSSSLSIIETIPTEPRDFRMFAPPKEHAQYSPICGRFASVEEAPLLLLLDESLPPLPTPLRRFCADGDHSPGCLQGMYPLVTPTPILRQSSYRSLMDDNNNNRDTSLHSKPKKLWDGQASFNLTKSWRPERAVSFDACSTSSSSSGSSNMIPNGKAKVRFDPRVTVTEFEDEIERSWYSEMELERLKYDTIIVAQEYLLTHPDQAEKYNRAILDPVTGSFRKKALFSLPILSALGEDSLPTPDNKEYEQLLKSQVQTILIVDPNKAILDLFCKSLHSMFPSARLYKTQSGDEALQLVSAVMQRGNNSSRGFDIVIVEQRLYKISSTVTTTTSSAHHHSKAKSLQFLSERGGMVPTTTFTAMHKPGSFSESARALQNSDLHCGSHLLKAIQQIEEECFSHFADSTKANGGKESFSEASVMICPRPIPRRALFIGVSMHPDHDARELREAGADIIWGKPIPRVGDALRNQLLHALVEKRRRALPDRQSEDSTTEA